MELLTSIPGIGQYAAVVILAEIGDFSRFKKAKQLVAFAGIDPAVKQSGYERIQAQQNQQARFPLPEKDTGYLHTLRPIRAEINNRPTLNFSCIL